MPGGCVECSAGARLSSCSPPWPHSPGPPAQPPSSVPFLLPFIPFLRPLPPPVRPLPPRSQGVGSRCALGPFWPSSFIPVRALHACQFSISSFPRAVNTRPGRGAGCEALRPARLLSCVSLQAARTGSAAGDGTLRPFTSPVCSSGTPSQTSVIFPSFGLSPFSPRPATGTPRRAAALRLSPAPPQPKGRWAAGSPGGRGKALARAAKRQPARAWLLSAQQDTATQIK